MGSMADSRKTVLITGCSKGGIGHAMAREFNSRGLRVFATVRDATSVPELAALGITPLALEVNKPESIRALHAEIQTLTGGKLDLLINNAGCNYTVPALDIDFEEVQLTFETNVFAVMRMCQTFAPMLIAAKGTIVQIGSVAGITPYVFGSVYNSSKAALHQYSNTLRVELKPFGVSVVTIITGGVQSRIARTVRTLPANSIYQPVAAEYDRRTRHSQEGAMNNEKYARSVASQVLVKKPKFFVWEGAKVGLVYFMHTFLPRWMPDYFFWRMFNLWKLVPGKAKAS